MSRQFSISAVKVTAANFVSKINPRFVKTEKGYLLTGYGADYQGTTATDHTELTVALENQNVTGLQIPKTLALKGQYSGTPFAVEVAFSGCTATGR